MRAAKSPWSAGGATRRVLAQVAFSTGRGMVSSTREKRWDPILAPSTAMWGPVTGGGDWKAAKKAARSNWVPL